MESPLFPGSDTEIRPVRRGEATAEGPTHAPALPELPPLAPDPPLKAIPDKSTPGPVADAAPPDRGKAQAPVTTCPRCEGKLVDTAGLGWCPRCGYCHSLEQDRAKVPVPTPTAARKGQDPGPREFLVLLIQVPFWFWVMVAGIGGVVAFTYLTAQPFRPTPFDRCVWCTVQIAAGALLMFLASFWALLHVAAEDETMTAKDLFLPVRLWTLTCKRLPRTRFQVWLAVWGVAAILSAAVLVGGLGEWLKYLPKPVKAEISSPAVTRHA